MCMARQRAATGAGEAKRLRRMPVMPTKIISMPASVPRPIRKDRPVTASSSVRASPKGSTAAIHVVWSRTSLMTMWMSRKTIEATAVVRCTACARIR